MDAGKTRFGFFEMLASTFIWGSIPIFAIWCSLPSAVFVFFRVVFALPFVFFYAYKKIGKRELFAFEDFAPVILSGVALSLNWVFLFLSFYFTPVANAIVIYYFGPILTVLLAVLFLKEKSGKALIVSVLFAVLGVLFIFLPGFGGSGSKIGILFALLSAIFYGLLGFFSKIATKRHSSVKLTAYQILVAAIFTAPFAFFLKFNLNAKILSLLVITGVVHTFLALYLWYDSLNYIKVSTASVLSYADPVFAVLLSAIVLKQGITLFQIAGLAFITLSGVAAFFNEAPGK